MNKSKQSMRPPSPSQKSERRSGLNLNTPQLNVKEYDKNIVDLKKRIDYLKSLERQEYDKIELTRKKIKKVM